MIQSVDWTTGLIDFHLKTHGVMEMLYNVAQSTISMLGNMIFEASSLADYLICVTTFTM